MTAVLVPTASEARFWAKVDKAGECWLWTAATDADGYGKFWLNDQMAQAHRVAYTLLVGAIPDGHEIDHSCRVRTCVRPEHLEAVVHRENYARSTHPSAGALRSGQCVNGHDYDSSNTYIDGRGQRACKKCRIEATRRWRARQGSSR